MRLAIAVMLVAVTMVNAQSKVDALFGGVRMAKRLSRPETAAVIIWPADTATNRLAWNPSESSGVELYTLYQYGQLPDGSWITNTYETDQLEIVIVYQWLSNVVRWFYHVTASIGTMESGPSNRVHDPLYPPDRMDLWVDGVSIFVLQTSAMLRPPTWQHFVQSSSPVTVMFSDPMRWYRAAGTTNAVKVRSYNPLNQ